MESCGGQVALVRQASLEMPVSTGSCIKCSLREGHCGLKMAAQDPTPEWLRWNEVTPSLKQML